MFSILIYNYLEEKSSVQERQLEKFQLLLIAGTKVTKEKAHIYSGTNNAIDSYKIPKSFKKDTFNFVRTRVSFQISVIR